MVKSAILKIIGVYKDFISPLLGKNCRFYPSCSDYMILSIKKYGVNKGMSKGLLRVFKCHPFSKGGVDLP
jgi:hypothetical protein